MGEPAAEPQPLLKAVLDTNVFVSGTILSRGAPFQVLEAWRQQAFILVTSKAIVAEIERVLRYPRIRERYAVENEDIERLIGSLRIDALIVSGGVSISGICADPDDDKFLACAVAAQADCIVTGDAHLLDLCDYEGIRILRPHDFLELLRATRARTEDPQASAVGVRPAD